MRIQHANRGYSKRVIMDDASKNLQKSDNLFKLNKTPFRHLGSGSKVINGQVFKRSAFRNLN